MTTSLYDLSGQYLSALDFFTDPEEDLPMQAINDTLEGLEGQIQEKSINVAKVLRNMEETAKSIKEAEKKMFDRRKAIENRVLSLKDYLKSNMEATGIQKIECPWFRLAIQKNPASVEIHDEKQLPDEYVTVELALPMQTYHAIKDQLGEHELKQIKADKTALKIALKAGKAISGACLSAGTRLVIR